jgi:hypothetical protein
MGSSPDKSGGLVCCCRLQRAIKTGLSWVTAFQEGLQKLGWAEGDNIAIEYRFTGGDPEKMRCPRAALRPAPRLLSESDAIAA